MCALLDDGKLLCIGKAEFGQLGYFSNQAETAEAKSFRESETRILCEATPDR